MKILWYHFVLLFPSFFIHHTRTTFLSSSFSFFSPSFFLLHTCTLTLIFFYFFSLFIPTTSSNLQNVPALLLPLFFFFPFFLSPFSLNTSSATHLQFFTLIFLIFSFSLNSITYKRDDSDWEDWIRTEQTQMDTNSIWNILLYFDFFFFFCILRNPNLQGIDFFFFP